MHIPRLEPVELRRQVGRDGVAQFVEDEGERHSVNVSGRRQLRRVDVGVRVDPDDAEVVADAAVSGDRPDREAVVAAKQHALVPGAHRPLHRVGDLQPARPPARRAIEVQEGLAVASVARDDPYTLPGDDPSPRARMDRDHNAR